MRVFHRWDELNSVGWMIGQLRGLEENNYFLISNQGYARFFPKGHEVYIFLIKPLEDWEKKILGKIQQKDLEIIFRGYNEVFPDVMPKLVRPQ